MLLTFAKEGIILSRIYSTPFFTNAVFKPQRIYYG